MNKIDSGADTAVIDARQKEIEQYGADQRLSACDIVANLLTCEHACTSILFRCGHGVFSPLLRGTLSRGTTYSLSFVDIDGTKLSTADGHVTVLVLATTADWEKARAVGERVPDY